MSTRTSRLVALIAIIVIGVGAGTLGYRLGRRDHQAVTARNGVAYASPYQAFAQSRGWTYAIPLDMPWWDSGGTLHEGRPSCLVSFKRTAIVFGTVDVREARDSWRSVVWVRC
jgi:hypothetical protein